MDRMDRAWILLAKKKAGEASAEEEEELGRLMEQGELRGPASEVIDRVWEAPLGVNPELRPEPRVWERLERQIGQPGVARLYPWGRWVAAASVLLVIVTAAVVVGGRRKVAAVALVGAAVKPNQYSTQPGSKSKLELPDGTQVWLNGNSKLTVVDGASGAVAREVYLSGEAFFDVAKNERAPFRIHTGAVDITVLGTAFNVKAYPGEKNVETALVRGLIEITTHHDPDRKIILKPNEKIIIPTDTVSLAGRGVTLGATSSVYAITALHQDRVLADTVWMQRKLEFDNESFAELAPKMEAWYDIRIRFGNDAIRGKRFSGVIEKETLEETLKDMRLSAPFTYTINGNELLIN